MTRTSDSHLSLTTAFPVRYAASLPVPRIQPDVPGTESFFCGGPMRNPHCTTQALFKRCDVIKGGASSSPRRSFLFPSKSSIREAPPYRPHQEPGKSVSFGLPATSTAAAAAPCGCLSKAARSPIWRRTTPEMSATVYSRSGPARSAAPCVSASMPNSVSPIHCTGWLQDGRKFERIREEPFGEIGQRLRGTIDTYGNEAVHQNTARVRSAVP